MNEKRNFVTTENAPITAQKKSNNYEFKIRGYKLINYIRCHLMPVHAWYYVTAATE